MKKNCFISVIIPVYNVEPYLVQCAKSVLNQSFRDIEVILVDDGSHDHCPEICDRLAAEDSRVRVIHKTNGGLSDARNAGIACAEGEYVLFLDSDDYWDDPQALERLRARVLESGADILNFSYKKVYEDSGQEIPYFCIPDMPIGLEFPAQLEYLAENGLFIASACNKMIRRSLLTGLWFEKGIYSEDITWCMDVAEKASVMDFVGENFYCYRQRSGSIVHTPSNKRCSDLGMAITDCFKRLNTAEESFQKLFLAYTAFQYGTFILVQAQAGEYQGQWIKRLAHYKWILKHHGRNRKLLCLRLGSLMLGYRGLCRLVRFIYGSKRK
ncbi:MAG: glycosyltransferase family 2 protein [Lachnospiraceae bacterium]|nr:glycosyltransferase family 2 protein [Lachnospiraceae bacterium]